MSISGNQKKQIVELLRKKIENKLKRYERETTSMPFLARLIQDNEKVAAYSFIHSIATTLGMSIYEEVSKILASENCTACFTKYGVGGVLSKAQKSIIANIVRELRNKERKPNIEREAKEILQASTLNGKYQKEGNIADLYILRGKTEYFFEIKTVKPNIDVFTKSKTKLLEWIARKRKRVGVILAFPYNPYHPEPYTRFTVQNMMNHPNDFLIGEEYWDFLSGKGTFKELLKIFDYVGKIYKSRIQNKIKQVASEKIKKH